MPIYYGYGRVSTEEQGRRYSISSQKEKLAKNAERLNLPFIFYYDEQSGKDFNRPGWQELISKIQEGDIFGAVFNDRIGRDTVSSLSIVKDLFYNKKVRIVVAEYEYNFDNPLDEMMYTQFAAVATFQRKLQLQKSKEGIQKKINKGEWKIRGDVLGYNNDKGKVTINGQESELIRYIFEQYNSGVSLNKIHKNLLEKGIRSRKGKVLHTQTIRRNLLNPVYKGFIKFADGKEIGSTIYPKIIEDDLWDACNYRLRNSEYAHAKKVKYRYSNYELSSLVYCKNCADLGDNKVRLIHCMVNRGGRTYSVYQSKLHVRGCKAIIKSIQGYQLENIFYNSFLLFLIDGQRLKEYFYNIKYEISKLTQTVTGQLNKVTYDINEVDSQLDNIVSKIITFQDSSITITEKLKENAKELEDKKTKLIKQKELLRKEKRELESSYDFDEHLEYKVEETLAMYLLSEAGERRRIYKQWIKESYILDSSLTIIYINDININIFLPFRRMGRRAKPTSLDMTVSYKGKALYKASLTFASNALRIKDILYGTEKFKSTYKARLEIKLKDIFNKVKDVIEANSEKTVY